MFKYGFLTLLFGMMIAAAVPGSLAAKYDDSGLVNRQYNLLFAHSLGTGCIGNSSKLLDVNLNSVDDVNFSASPSETILGNNFLLNTRPTNIVCSEYFADSFAGDIYIAESEAVTFYLDSDDGSKFWIEGKLWIDNDGVHGAQEKSSGGIFLAKGWYYIEVKYFSRGGGSQLKLSYSSASIGAKQEIPTSVLRLGGAFDSDSDDQINYLDKDDDNDGVNDVSDDFPYDASETLDTDRDGIGNNADSDDDNDGVLDVNDDLPLDATETIDTDGDGIGNNADTDDDGDGVDDSTDVFPLDPTESLDSDGDGHGNNSDDDDDNDQMPDNWEITYGLDPLVPNGADDSDGDSLTDFEEYGLNTDPTLKDSDGDGYDDNLDVNPTVSCLNNYVVSNNADSGSNTLRQALIDVCPNGNISFSSAMTIHLQSTLYVTNSPFIDGENKVTLSGDSDNNGSADVRILNNPAGSTVSLTGLTFNKGISGATRGGAIYNSGTMTVERSAFYQNVAGYRGGAIANESVITINNSIFANNEAYRAGGAFLNRAGATSAILSNNTFYGNYLVDVKEGDVIYNAAPLTLNNNLITGNIGPKNCHNAAGGTLTNNNNWIEDGTCGAAYSGTISLAAPVIYDLRPVPGSASIDAGLNIALSIDYLGNTRTQNSTIDIGATEYDPTGDFDGDGVLDTSDDFPSNASASLDSDLDGMPDFCVSNLCTGGLVEDIDDDNDGFSDIDEVQNSTDPLDNSSFPSDADGDFVSDLNDIDNNNNDLIDINSLSDLDEIRNNRDGTSFFGKTLGCPNECAGFELLTDLDFDTSGDGIVDVNDTYWNAGLGWQPIADRSNPLQANFEGNSHTIRNLYINRPTENYVGLISYTRSNVSVQNLKLLNVRITGQDYTAGLIGGADRTSISNIAVVGRVDGSAFVGGVVGVNQNNLGFSDSYHIGRISANSYVTGGVLGYNSEGNIDKVFHIGPIYSERSVGGVVGTTNADISNSYSAGLVIGINQVGGIVGSTTGNKIENVYSVAKVKGTKSYVGALVGDDGTKSEIINSYWQTGNAVAGLGLSNVADASVELSYQQMTCPQQAGDSNCSLASFVNWDDTTPIWNFGDNQQLPYLVIAGQIYQHGDYDNDGVDDVIDLFPSISIGANIDTDADGAPNDCDATCIAAGLLADDDDDNDGVTDGSDAFPLDATESVDFDGDGIGNNADADDDNDGVVDGSDAFPLDASESVDTDSDGIGNNADTDDDNDGVVDSSDAFPLDASESLDTDSDGIGNNVDTDDDNDGIDDSSDAFPLDASESVDTDSDGIGNNADTDDDNDGIADGADVDKDGDQLIEITSLNDLSEIRNNLTGQALYGDTSGCIPSCNGFELTASLDFDTNDDSVVDDQDSFWNSGAGWQPIGANESAGFSAIFDGNGFTIKNLFIAQSATDGIGLFGYTNGNAKVRNLGLLDTRIIGNNRVGALAGYAEFTTFSQVYSTGKVSGRNDVGGLLGGMKSGSITQAYHIGYVSAIEYQIGGIVGIAANADTINQVFNIGSVLGADYVAGIAGVTHSPIINAYSAGTIQGDRYIGGVMGVGSNVDFQNIYSLAKVKGNKWFGALSGLIASGNFTDSYWLTGQAQQAFGYLDQSTEATTEAIQNQLQCPMSAGDSNCGSVFYANWDDSTPIWQFGRSDQYPALQIGNQSYFLSDYDNDGISDLTDTFPSISLSGLADNDNDGVPDNCDSACLVTGLVADNDDDNDDVIDSTDAFPFDASEWLDTDGNGVGNNADDDDDGDGVLDVNDQAPLDPNAYDLTQPVVTAPNNITVAAVNASGTPASNTVIASFLNSASAVDDFDGNVAVSHDAVNVFPLGSSVVTFTSQDAAGNIGTAQATVTIADQNKPVISLSGNTAITLNFNESYTEPGYSASDNVDGDISGNVIVSGLVETTTLGTYTLSYDVSDAAGNAAQTQTRQIIVQDGNAPVVNAPNNISVAAVSASGTSISDSNITTFLNSANANDDVDGVVNVSHDAPNIFALGATVVTFTAQDTAGNIGTAQATVTVSDQAKPVITLSGNTSITLNFNESYTEPGYSANDNVDGDISANVLVSGAVDTSTVGTYTLSYDVSDAAGNGATTQTRQVTVQDASAPVVTAPNNITVAAVSASGTSISNSNIATFLNSANATDDVDGAVNVTHDSPNTFPLGTTVVTFTTQDTAGNIGMAQATVTVSDQDKPVISLSGNTSITLNFNESYTEPGYSASDNVDGDISANVIVSGLVDITTLGSYTLSYDVSDVAGNTAQSQTRQVIVQDIVAPVVIAPNNITVAATDGAGTSAYEPSIFNFLNSFTITDDVDNNPIASYKAPLVFPLGTTLVIFSAKDSSGNIGTAQASVTVVDQAAPVISLVGNTSITLSVNSIYTESGYSASDNVDGDISANVLVSGVVDTSTVGTYTLSYDVSDAAGNGATTQTRQVTVQDASAPVVTAPNNITVAATDAGGTSSSDTDITNFLSSANATDDVDGAVSVSHDSPNTFPLGTTVVTFTAQDAAGNIGTAQATVTVSDQAKPVISLSGNNSITLSVNNTYNEPGYSASDNVDGDISSNVMVSGAVDTSTVGTYTLSYDVSDAAGNGATTQTRQVTVQDASAPVVTAPNNITVAATDAGGTSSSDTDITNFLNSANATDDVDGAVSVSHDSPNTFPLGTTVVTFTAQDTAGNIGTAQATVTVSDQAKPVISLSGNTSITLNFNESYTDPGYSASDNVDGDISANVLVSGAVDTSTVGTYTLSYDVSDAAGNGATTQTRQVTVQGASTIDSDDDGIVDSEDVFPLDATEWLDTDNDGIGNNADIDDDDDGILDEEDSEPLNTEVGDTHAPVIGDVEALTFEATSELTGVSLAAPEVTDNNLHAPSIESDLVGVIPLGEHIVTWTATDFAGNQASKEQLITIVDTTAPEFEELTALTVNAKGRLTDLSAIVDIQAFDLVDGEVDASISGEDKFVSGRHELELTAMDGSGNIATGNISVDILPKVSIRPKAIVEAGGSYQVAVDLSGQAPKYPVSIDYQITVNGDAADPLTTVIETNTRGLLLIDVPEDVITSDKVTLSLISASNAFVGYDNQSQLVVVDNNIAPLLDIKLTQNGELVSVIDPDNGVVTITAMIEDINQNDDHDITWAVVNNAFVDAENDGDDFTFELEPSHIGQGVYSINISAIENNTEEMLSVSHTLFFAIEKLVDLSDQTDSDNDGMVDSEEGYSDSDGDGIADYLDNDSNMTRLPSAANTHPMQTSPGLKMSLGSLALVSSGASSQYASLTLDGLAQVVGENAADIRDSHYVLVSPLYNFVIDGLTQVGDSVAVVIPLEQESSLPEGAVYRKFNTQDGWYSFVEDENNTVSSALADENGICPAAGEIRYTQGLAAGDNCIQLIIEDGGPNDTEFTVNGLIEDPGAVVIKKQNQAPVIVLPESYEVDEETPITLDASNTTGAEGNELSFSWVQVSGTSVELPDASSAQLDFTSPSVSEDEILTFELTVDDGWDSSLATVQVIVYQVNKAPVVMLDSHPASYLEETTVVLSSQSFDPDGDVISYHWEQISGPSVRFGDATSAKVSITLPEVSADTNITVQLMVSDGDLSTAESTIITVTPEKKNGGSMDWLLVLVLIVGCRKVGRLK